MNDATQRLQRTVVECALQVANNMRATAERLERTAAERDFARLAEIQLSQSTWTIDQVRGAALTLVRLGDDR